MLERSPIPQRDSVAAFCKPAPKETSVTTAAVPIITPTAVSRTRPLRRLRFATIKLTRSENRITFPSVDYKYRHS